MMSLTAFAQSEPYAVLSDDGLTVTFYYDDQKATRGGININNSYLSEGSSSPYGTATTAVFDASFADYRPVSTAYWFHVCSSLTTITGIENLNTSNVTSMSCVFSGCSGLTSLDVSGFNTSKVTSMSGMFQRSPSLTTIYADETKWSAANVTNSNNMFSGCTSLVGGRGTVFDADHTDAEYARIDKPGRPGYFTGKGQEMEPIENGETIDIGMEIDENTDLNGNMVGDIFYSIGAGDGSYNAAEGCLVVTKPTNDSDIDGKDIFGEDFKAGYTGIVFKIAPGKGTIRVEAQTTGNMVLKVKIGNSDPIEMELDGKLKVKFPYNVSEPTYVYIYGGTRASSGVALLKIYGFEVISDASGIEAIENGKQTNADAPVYNLSGQRVNKATKGIYIKNGKKVLVK